MWRSDVSSYPPPFRQTNLPERVFTQKKNHPERASANNHPPLEHFNQHALDLLPIIDLQYPNAHTLEKACRDWGLFRLINHGIPDTLSNQVRCHARDLFSLPFESKQTQFTHSITYFWGTPVLNQSVRNLNRVEGFHLPHAKVQSQHKRHKDPICESFRCLLEEYGHHMARIGRTVFDILVKNLTLDSTQMASFLSESNGLLRVYRYPCYDGNDQVFGMDAHTDSSVLSILSQDEVGGLQLLRGQKWVDVKPIPNTLIVNLGDMMQAISNDEYKSAKHRVAVNKSTDRMSICYFAFPMEDRVILSSNYKAFTYKEFQAQVQEDIKVTGYKVGLERFKIGETG